MSKYPNIKEIKNKIVSNGVAHLTFHATDINDIIHLYSLSGYEYLSGEFVEFLDRFRSIIPHKMPIVLEIAGAKFNSKQKEIIDRAIWMNYGLYLSEADINLKKQKMKLSIFLILMILSSCLLFLVDRISEEVIVNYGYLLFWFFGYRILTYLLLDCLPIYKEYQWYRHLAAVKLIFSDDEIQQLERLPLSKEIAHYEQEADVQTKKQLLIDYMFMEKSCLSLGCRIEEPEEVLLPSGVEGIEILSGEMSEYLLGALPFIKQKCITKLEIEGNNFSDDIKKRLSDAIRNHLAFLITNQHGERKNNREISFVFAIGLVLSTIFLYILGQNSNLAIHEFSLVSFWFFADYLLEFMILSRMEIKSRKRTLEKLANMDITFETR